MLSGRLLVQMHEDLLQTLNLSLGLFQMLCKKLLQLRILRALRKLWQRLHQLILRAVHIAQLIQQNIFKWHIPSPVSIY